MGESAINIKLTVALMAQCCIAVSLGAELEITDRVIAPDPVPFGQNLANPRQFFNSVDPARANGFETFLHRQKYHVTAVGKDENGEWFEAGKLSQFKTYSDGFYDDAVVRVYRWDGQGPYERVRTDRVSRSQLGREPWNVTFQPYDMIPASVLSFTDARKGPFGQQTDLDPGRTYYYTVRSVDAAGRESEPSAEVSATPAAADSGVRVLTASVMVGGRQPELLEASGDNEPLTWMLVQGPSFLTVTPKETTSRTKGELSGLDKAGVDRHEITVRVTDAQGNRDERVIVVNPDGPETSSGNTKRKGKQQQAEPEQPPPLPPASVEAIPAPGGVTVSWSASPRKDVIGYRVYRSTSPREQQQDRIYLQGTGEPIQVGDVVLLDVEKTEQPISAYHERLQFQNFPWYLYKEPGQSRWLNVNKDFRQFRYPPELSYQIVEHPGPIPAEFKEEAGRGCLRMTADPGWGIGHGRLITHQMRGRSDNFYNEVFIGKKYRFSCWMRQEGIPGGKVEIFDNGLPELSRTLEVDGVWKQYDIDFVPKGPETAGNTTIRFDDGGTLWLDCVRLCETECGAGFAQMRPEWKEQLQLLFDGTHPGERGFLRYWGLHNNKLPGPALADRLVAQQSARSGSGPSLPEVLELCQQINANPWLIVSLSNSEEEWRQLIEYLAGDADTPLGILRREHRNGNPKPWSDEFEKIIIECDNETWNFSFNWCFPGDRDKGINRAEQYGAFSEMLFQAAKSHPAWKEKELDKKILFSVGGWRAQPQPNGYGALAMNRAPSAALFGNAPYLGGWESGRYLGGSTLTDEGISQWLMYLPWTHQNTVDQFAATADEIGNGRPVGAFNCVYEGGPGYDLPGPGKPSNPVAEAYGKSLAAAITTLDCYLYESSRGYQAQCFFLFDIGTRWTTHAFAWGEDGGIVPCPQTTFHALRLRNLACSGSMVEVKQHAMPTADLPEIGRAFPEKKGVALLGAYAFRDQDRLSVILLSRAIDQRDETGAVLNPSIIPVKMKLPIAGAAKVKLYCLRGDPRQSNVPGAVNEAPQPIEIETKTLGAFDGGSFAVTAENGGVSVNDTTGIAPGSVYVYEFTGLK
jgi:hypothetical protein